MATTIIYFTGAGDDGTPLLFDMASTDTVKSVDITFNSDIFVKAGQILSENAPFGASVDIEVVHPTYGVVGQFGNRIPVLGSGIIPLDSENSSAVPAGLILRITVHNSDIAPAAFKIAGRIEMLKTTG